MIWLDSVLAIPSVGLGLGGRIASALQIRDVLLPFIEDHFKLQQVSFPQNSPIETVFSLGNGFRIKAGPRRLYIEYEYSVVSENIPGQLPQPQPPQIQVFSKILEEELEIIRRIWEEVTVRLSGLQLSLMGIVAQSFLAQKEMPPGVTRFFDHLKKPWPLGLWTGEGVLVATIDKQSDGYNRCHHRFNAPFHQENGEMNFGFDFQHVLTPPRTLSQEAFEKLLSGLNDSALSYFETFAEGTLKYD